jgi:hypothetical protein
MSTTSSLAITTGNSLLRHIALGGLIIGTVQLIVQQWIVFSLVQGNPLISVLQYIASAVMGNAAFEGGVATALLGVLFHYFISFVIAAVFILSADRIPFLRRYAVAGALLYGFGVFVVMNLIVIPLSAAPPLPAPTVPLLIEMIVEHILVIGLPLGILVRRSVHAEA